MIMVTFNEILRTRGRKISCVAELYSCFIYNTNLTSYIFLVSRRYRRWNTHTHTHTHTYTLTYTHSLSKTVLKTWRQPTTWIYGGIHGDMCSLESISCLMAVSHFFLPPRAIQSWVRNPGELNWYLHPPGSSFLTSDGDVGSGLCRRRRMVVYVPPVTAPIKCRWGPSASCLFNCAASPRKVRRENGRRIRALCAHVVLGAR